ncbi:sensor histidine kinase [Stackebrandtia nassauensis]|uniref:histidine kinase n=1 Tax=Stackebrandtia nassauensis (strain DSM 44728 / CIP 108903 / NRRL B-16338 / NBRC 102104 / LLR-40K-21) TaxID=446470 RepID=D3PYY8_STANL|nr:sensor histidine kinase [Stackebrandtia nassauensis]ADD45417.1 histidine kinase [Stackebrandtia nassauensis DSM 44728]
MNTDRDGVGGRRWVRVNNGRAPLFLSGLFYFAVALLLTSSALDLGFLRLDIPASGGSEPLNAWGFLAATVVAAVVWPLLRWSRDGGRFTKLASVVFVAAVTLLLSVGGWAAIVLEAMVTVHIVFAFGLRFALGYVVALAVTSFGISWWYRGSVAIAVIETAISVVFALWAIAMAKVLQSEQRQAEQTRRLLAERTEAHEELRRYAARVKELTVSEERARMSREMHDSVGHYLTVISLGLRNAQRYREAGVGDAWAEVAQARQLTTEALEETRRWVKALRPLALEDRAGPAAMAALAESFSGFEVDFQAGDGLPELDENVELLLYRSLQEGLANVARHSGATRVTVRLSGDERSVRLSITDDGRGADPDRADGFGLAGLRQRAEAAGGTVATSRPDTGGFTLTIEAPTAPRPAMAS